MNRAAGIAAVAVLVGFAATACTSGQAAEPAERQSQVTMVDSPDRSRFLDGVAKRDAAVAEAFTGKELVKLGRQACELRDGYVSGSRPAPSERFSAMLVDAGRSQSSAGDAAYAIENAAVGTLCTVESVEVPAS